MSEILDERKAAKVLGLTRPELLYNVGLGRIPALKLQKKDGKEIFRFDMEMIHEAMRKGTIAEKSLLGNYKPGRFCHAS